MKKHRVLTVGNDPVYGFNICNELNRRYLFEAAGPVPLSVAVSAAADYRADTVIFIINNLDARSAAAVSAVKQRLEGVFTVVLVPFSSVGLFPSLCEADLVFTGLTPFQSTVDSIESFLLASDSAPQGKNAFHIDDVMQFIADFGLNPSKAGSLYIAKSVTLAANDPFFESVTFLFEETARLFSTNSSAVEAGARLALSEAFSQYPERFHREGFYKCPSLTAFMKRLFKKVRRCKK